MRSSMDVNDRALLALNPNPPVILTCSAPMLSESAWSVQRAAAVERTMYFARHCDLELSTSESVQKTVHIRIVIFVSEL